MGALSVSVFLDAERLDDITWDAHCWVWGVGSGMQEPCRLGALCESGGGAGTAAMIGFPHYLKVERSHETLHKPKWCKVKKR